EGDIIGRAEGVNGIDAALKVLSARDDRIHRFPGIDFEGMDRELERWAYERMQKGDPWTFVIRDNVGKRWIRLKGAFVTRHSGMSATWAINGIGQADGPY